MKKISFKIVLICLMSVGISSCDQKPKVVSATSEDSKSPQSNSGIFTDKIIDDESSNPDVISSDVHTVVVNEVLPTEK